MFGEHGGVVRKMQIKVKTDQGMMFDNMSVNQSVDDGGFVDLRNSSLIYGSRRQTQLNIQK